MNKDDYLDKKIPEGSGEPDWFTVPDKDLSHLEWFNPQRELTKRMHELQDRWNLVYRKIKKERLF